MSSQERKAVRPELLASGGALGRYDASIKVEAWNTTSHAVRIVAADATGQHASTVHLSQKAAFELEQQIRACREARQEFDREQSAPVPLTFKR
ncbi:MAG: hypothetical protein PF501_18375 [Salinisphaera sp.]|jgi:hypothetical protein|nr:hypothetical protein [Salinisphaera sp.]